jgi:hypothetical protein
VPGFQSTLSHFPLIPFFFIASCSRALIAFDLAPITPACSFFERFLLTHLLSLSTFRQLVLLHQFSTTISLKNKQKKDSQTHLDPSSFANFLDITTEFLIRFKLPTAFSILAQSCFPHHLVAINTSSHHQ